MLKAISKLPGFVMFASLFILLITAGCTRSLDDAGPNPPGGGLDGETVIAGVRGVVIDENNQPVQGATITSGTYSTTTDRYGVFRFNSINLSKNNAYIKINHPGYFTGHRTFVASAGRIHNVRIRLLPKSNTGNFMASAGGTVSLGTGGKLVMPSNAVTDAGGSAYSGAVNIAMTWINPAASNLPEIMVGDLRGITANGEERGLATYGMLGVEMTSPGGQVLKIAPGKTAELTFPIPASLLANAPATIDLWHFDETKGRWIQEGTATKTGNNYVGQVSHFSFWNVDAPFPLVNLCMTLLNSSNNQPLVNVMVRIKRTDGSYGYSWTDSTGNLCGKVPKNELLTLEVVDQCYNVIYSQTIGPFSADANLGNVTVLIAPINQLTIIGNLINCTNANVTNGSVQVFSPGAHSYSVPVSNGSFNLTIPICGNSINFSVKGVDYTNLQLSAPTSATGTAGSTINVGNIQACNASPQQFIEVFINGFPSFFLVPPDTIQVIETTGVPPYSNTHIIQAFSMNPNMYNYFYLSFNNNATPGNMLPINSFQISTIIPLTIVSPNPTVEIISFGPPGTGYIEGSFNLSILYMSNTRNAICHFRIRRP